METETEVKRLHRAFVEVGARIQLSDDKDHRNLHFIVWQGVGRTFAVLILAVTLLLVELNRVSSALTCESNIVSRRTYYFHHFIYFEKSTEARVYGNVRLVLHSHPLCSCFSGADRFISKLKEWLPFLGFLLQWAVVKKLSLSSLCRDPACGVSLWGSPLWVPNVASLLLPDHLSHRLQMRLLVFNRPIFI